MPVRVRSSRPAHAPAARQTSAIPFGLPVPPRDCVQKPAGLSLCMIVKDEERFLEQCLQSVAGMVDEINIVDTGSTDRTVEIAERFGARVEHRPWRNDFGWARNESLAMATKRWIIQLDADEELVPGSGEALARIKTAPAHTTGLWIRCINRSDQYHGSGEMSHAVTRVFPNSERIRFTGAIHEFVSLDGGARTIDSVNSDVKIVHHGYLSDVVAGRNKFARNLEIIEAAIEAEPDEAFHWYNLGVTTYLQGNGDRTAAAFERMWELCKDEPRGFTPNGLQIWADTLNERLGDPKKGLEIATRCLRYAPRYANAHFSAGKSLMLLERFEESRAMYEAAIADGAHNARQFVVDDEVPTWKAQSEIGATFVIQGDDAKALEWFERGLANRPNVAPLRLNRARALERVGRIVEAEAAFRLLYDDLRDEQATLNLVNFLLRQPGKESGAISVVEEMYQKLDTYPAVTLLIAAAAVVQRLGIGDGERHLRMALDLAPGWADVLNPLESIYAQRGDSASIETLRAAERETQPIHAADYLRRSQLRLAERAYEMALEMANAGLQAFPNNGLLSYNAAIASINLDRKDEALRHLTCIGKTDGAAYVQGAYLRAVVLRELGRPAEALEAVDGVLGEEEGHVDATLLRAALLEHMTRSDEAEAALLALMPAAKQRVGVELAGLYLRTGRVADAKRIAEEALA
ncbi:MAG TPA: glycosyltransferase [Candidatus Baltobacteraceae bacterium]